MKLKTNIARLLTTGLLLNNICFYSNASALDNEIPNRYETLEGEYITINNSTEGELKEFEILGNTIQNKNNLEDIQSVGDLYVNEGGKPILDSQGRKQYKIEAVSHSKNLFKSLNLENAIPEINYSFLEKDSRKCISIAGNRKVYINADYEKLKVGQSYTISGEAFIVSGTKYRIRPIIEYQDGTSELITSELFNNYFKFPYDTWEKVLQHSE